VSKQKFEQVSEFPHFPFSEGIARSETNSSALSWTFSMKFRPRNEQAPLIDSPDWSDT
jgi:hypothetical protein